MKFDKYFNKLIDRALNLRVHQKTTKNRAGLNMLYSMP